MVIDLPNVNIKDKLDTILDTSNFESDNNLVEYLTRIYNEIKEAHSTSTSTITKPILTTYMVVGNVNFDKLPEETLTLMKEYINTCFNTKVESV